MTHAPKPILKPIPLTEVENRASALLRQCMRELNLYRLPLPVPVDTWLEKPLGFGLEITDLSHLGDGVLGAAFPKEREIHLSASMSEEKNPGRFRFTAAHELGHMTLHANAGTLFRDGDTQPGSRPRHELEADRFAAAFLMPQEEFLPAITLAGDAAGFDAFRLFSWSAQLEETLPLWNEKVIPFLVDRFGVSTPAAIFRLSELNMLDGTRLLSRGLIDALRPEWA